MQENIKNHYF